MEENKKEKRVMKLASRGKRLGAALIDRAPIWIIIMILWGGIIAMIASSYSYYRYDGYGYHNGGSLFGGGLTAFAFLLMFVYIGVQIYFFTRSQTIGKAILGMRVVSSENGYPIGFGKMLLREVIVKQASEAIFYLGYIWILIDDRNRGWHDKILDTYVVDEKETELMKQQANRGEHPSYSDPNSEIAVEPSDDPYTDPVSYTITADELAAQQGSAPQPEAADGPEAAEPATTAEAEPTPEQPAPEQPAQPAQPAQAMEYVPAANAIGNTRNNG